MVVKWVTTAGSDSSGASQEFMLAMLEVRSYISFMFFSLTFSREVRS
jgi:hypothetical protein